MRRLFRWAWRVALALLILAALCAVAAILLLDTIAREVLVRRLRSATGMEVKISAVHVGLLSPTLTIEGFKLYNTADFGGAVCVDMPELHIEYDAAALRARQLHLTLLRLDLENFSLVRDARGRKNFGPEAGKSDPAARRARSPNKWEFTGIDVLNATLGKCHEMDLASGRGEEIDFDVKNQILRRVKTWNDLAPLGLPRNLDLGPWLENLLQSP